MRNQPPSASWALGPWHRLSVLATVLVFQWTNLARAEEAQNDEPPDSDVSASAEEILSEEELRYLEMLEEGPGLGTVVTGTRTKRALDETPVPTELIRREELVDMGQQDLSGVMREQPGVELEPSFNAVGIRLQGLDPSYVLILVDGQRAIGRIGGAIDLRRFRLENIERVEIVRGAASALYGSDGLGGVVNIITRDVTQPLASEASMQLSAYDGEVDSLGALNLSGSVASGDEDSGYRITAGLHENEAYDLNPDDEATTGGFNRFYDVAGMARRRITDRLTLRFQAGYERRDLEAVDTALGGGGAVYDRFNITETSQIALLADYEISDDVQWQTRMNYGLFRDQFVLDQRGSTLGDQDQETREYLGQIESYVTLALGDDHVLTTGIDLLLQDLSGERIREADARTRQRFAAYAQDEWSLSESVTLVPGVRFDGDSQFGSQLSPKLTARYDVTETVVARASYGAGFRAPSFKDLYLTFENLGVGYVVDGNPDLEPERSQSVNLNLEWTPTARLLFQVDGYGNQLRDLIDFDIVGGGVGGEPLRFQNVNRERGWTAGTTVSGRVLLTKGLSLGASYGYQRARFTETDPQGESVSRDLPGRAPHRVTGNLRFNRGAYSAVVRAQWSAARPFYTDERGVPVDADPNATTLADPVFADPFTTVNVRAARRFGPLEVFAGVDNALNAGDPVYLPIAPRTFFAGVKGTYDVEN